MDGLLQPLGGEARHLRRQLGAGHDRGVPIHHGLDDRSDLLLEAHVQHSVHLVEDDVVHAAHQVRAVLHDLAQYPRRANEHVGINAAKAETTIHANRLNAQTASNALQVRLYMNGELARRRHD